MKKRDTNTNNENKRREKIIKQENDNVRSRQQDFRKLNCACYLV